MNKENIFTENVMNCRASVLGQHILKELWKELSDICITEDLENNVILDEDFYIFKKGTKQEDVWHWFDERLDGGLGKFLEKGEE